jgi:flavin reductase (DIM6/NTAB) family NADH-FMN oxidoreductase RutF
VTTSWPADPVLDQAALRRLYGCFPSGVVAVCARGPEGPVGLAASSFTSVSMDPPLVSFCIQNTSTTWPKLADLPRLGVSVLGSAHSAACLQLSRKTGDRFVGLAITETADGAVFVDGSPAQLDCSVEDLVPAGDHQIVLLRVHAARALPEDEPLVFHASAFRELVGRPL